MSRRLVRIVQATALAVAAILSFVPAGAAQSRGAVTAEASGGLAAAVAAVGSAPAELSCSTPQTLQANLLIPANIAFAPQPGCIVRTNGFHLYINGPVQAGVYQIFAPTDGGSVRFGWDVAAGHASHALVVEDYPEWFGGSNDCSTDDALAVEAADLAWSGPGTVRFQAAGFPGASGSPSCYYFASNAIKGTGTQWVGAGGDATQAAEWASSTWFRFAPGYGIYTYFDPAEGGGGITGIGVTCATDPMHAGTGGCMVFGYPKKGSPTIALAPGAPQIFHVGDMIGTDGYPVGVFPPNTTVVSVGAHTVTVSADANFTFGGDHPVTARIYLVSPASLAFSGAVSSSSNAITGISSEQFSRLVVGEELYGSCVAGGIPVAANGAAYAYIGDLDPKTRTVYVYGDPPAAFPGTPIKSLCDGPATIYPSMPAFDITGLNTLKNDEVTFWSGNGFDIHATHNGHEPTYSNYDEVDRITAINLVGEALDISGMDANAISVTASTFGYNGGDCIHDSGEANHFVGTGFESCGEAQVWEEYPVNNEYSESYGEGDELPVQLGQSSVSWTNADFGFRLGNDNGFSQSGRHFVNGWQNQGDTPATWFNAVGDSHGYITPSFPFNTSPTCITGVTDIRAWSVGSPISDNAGMIRPGTMVSAIGKCDGVYSLTLSQWFTPQQNKQYSEHTLLMQLAPRFDYGTFGGSAGALWGLMPDGDAFSNAPPADSLQWYVNRYLMRGDGLVTKLPYAWRVFGDVNAGPRWAFGCAAADTPAAMPNGCGFAYPLSIGTWTGAGSPGAGLHIGADLSGGKPASGSSGVGAGDLLLTNNPAVAAYKVVAGGKIATGATASFTAGSSIATARNASAREEIAAGDTLAGAGLPNATVTVRGWYNGTDYTRVAWDGTHDAFEISLPAAATESSVAVVASRAGKIHAADDTITTNSSAVATLSAADNWAAGDTVACATCDPGTFIASIVGTQVKLSRPANGNADHTPVYDVRLDAVPLASAVPTYANCNYQPRDASGAGVAITVNNSYCVQIGIMVFVGANLTYGANADPHPASLTPPSIVVPPSWTTPDCHMQTAVDDNLQLRMYSDGRSPLLRAATGQPVTNASLSGHTVAYQCTYPAR